MRNIVLFLFLPMVILSSTACSSGGGGGGAAPVIPDVSYIFAAGCTDASCNEYSLFKIAMADGSKEVVGAAAYDEVNPSGDQTRPQIAVLQDKVIFAGENAAIGSEMFIYDPNEPEVLGVNPLPIDIVSGTGHSDPQNFTAVGNKLYFYAQTPAEGAELWVLDPGQAISVGTNPKIVIDLVPGASGSEPYYFATAGGKLYYSAQEVATGRELYVYNPAAPTLLGTNPALIMDIEAGGGGSNTSDLIAVDGKIAFTAYNAANGSEPWIYDPSTAVAVGVNPKMMGNIRAGGDSSYPARFVGIGGIVYFHANSNGSADEFFQFDPSEPSVVGVNPVKVFDLRANPLDNEDIRELVALDGKVYFRGVDDVQDDELHIYNPAQAVSVGVNPRKVDIVSGAATTYPWNLASIGGKLFFNITDVAVADMFPFVMLDPGASISIGTNPQELLSMPEDGLYDLALWVTQEE